MFNLSLALVLLVLQPPKMIDCCIPNNGPSASEKAENARNAAPAVRFAVLPLYKMGLQII